MGLPGFVGEHGAVWTNLELALLTATEFWQVVYIAQDATVLGQDPRNILWAVVRKNCLAQIQTNVTICNCLVCVPYKYGHGPYTRIERWNIFYMYNFLCNHLIQINKCWERLWPYMLVLCHLLDVICCLVAFLMIVACMPPARTIVACWTFSILTLARWVIIGPSLRRLGCIIGASMKHNRHWRIGPVTQAILCKILSFRINKQGNFDKTKRWNTEVIHSFFGIFLFSSLLLGNTG